jgi:hypothetical protein
MLSIRCFDLLYSNVKNWRQGQKNKGKTLFGNPKNKEVAEGAKVIYILARGKKGAP